MSPTEAKIKYGTLVDGKWLSEITWCLNLSPPTGLSWVNSLTGLPVKHIYCNADLVSPLTQALRNVVVRKLADQLKTFDGCFVVRDVRGEPGKPSAHSYAIAIDINAATNQLGTEGDMSAELAACFTDAGLVHGRSFARKDPMHFSLGW